MIVDVVAELVLIRHGQSASNVAFPEADAAGLLESGLSGRDADVALTRWGVEQARAVGAWLAALPSARVPQVVVTSPYVRARETWRIAAEASGRELPAPATDDRLVDRLLGDLEMLTRAAVAQRFPDEPGRRAAVGEYRYRPPNGEAFEDVAARVAAFLDDLHREHAGRRVVVVAHDSVVLMMRFVIEGLDWDGVAAVADAGPVRNASITRFDGSSGRLVLAGYNTVDHLAP
ncbi:histidine phosphatase family protein [Couchioplanes caeruleus]|uniref:phosphoglycerate mutase (2,3-diphosphoglycerate-dependent) n=1 Tax=Couchioplanes caeruleus TaxID=56438 RepID=A0A3N1GFL0_9ACTN|nr:histidine phosphatase family protein [Couchioplanes caeruleus]ROP29082.1 broad specificity phosphatase PhoE [Couchioplanes caeruleus]